MAVMPVNWLSLIFFFFFGGGEHSLIEIVSIIVSIIMKLCDYVAKMSKFVAYSFILIRCIAFI